MPLLRRELCASSRTLRGGSFSATANALRGRTAGVSATTNSRDPRIGFLSQTALRGQTRAFTQSLRRKYTDEEGNWDPRLNDRESDEVDVCIVGGGKKDTSFKVCNFAL